MHFPDFQGIKIYAFAILRVVTYIFILYATKTKMIIGVTGPICSGKSVLAEMLVKKGFIRMTLSEEVRAEARLLGLPIERKVLQDLGNERRMQFGNGYWATRLIKKMNPTDNYIVEGIRNPGEIDELEKMSGFMLIGVTAPIERRIDWIKERNKDSDPKTEEAIKAIDARDRGEGEASTGQRSEDCFAQADIYIFNNSTLEELNKRAIEIVGQFSKN